jgi:hypothetical protein
MLARREARRNLASLLAPDRRESIRHTHTKGTTLISLIAVAITPGSSWGGLWHPRYALGSMLGGWFSKWFSSGMIPSVIKIELECRHGGVARHQPAVGLSRHPITQFRVTLSVQLVARRTQKLGAIHDPGLALRMGARPSMSHHGGSPCLHLDQHGVVVPGASQPEADRVAHVGSAAIGEIGQTKAGGSGREQARDLLTCTGKKTHVRPLAIGSQFGVHGSRSVTGAPYIGIESGRAPFL